MGQAERIGVSLEKDLLKSFDKLTAKQGYSNRSEAIRDLIRQQLNCEKASNPKTKAVAAVCLVYDHHSSKLMDKLTALQHSHILQVVSSMHVHLDKHDCMEIIVLKGKISEIENLAESLLSLKGVKLGKINLVPA